MYSKIVILKIEMSGRGGALPPFLSFL